MTRAAILSLLLAGCAHQAPVSGPHTIEAAPVVATSRTSDPRNIACSPADEATGEPSYRTVQQPELEAQIVDKKMPQLAEGEGGYGRYLVSVAVDGHVRSVRLFEALRGNLAIAAALCQWRLKPQLQPLRAVLMLGFSPTPRRFH